jgi:hypothetical protein
MIRPLLETGYLVVGVILACRYYGRRHGVPYAHGEQGYAEVLGVVLLWPMTLFIAGVKAPALCGHPRHVLTRERLRAEVEQVQRVREEGR